MSKTSMERAKMSAEVDVFEMQEMCGKIAHHHASGKGRKAEVREIMTRIGVGANRAYELLTGRARRVDGWEKDNARGEINRIEEARYAEHLQWLKAQIEHHRANGKGLRGPHVDALEHFLRDAGGEARAVAPLDEELTTDKRGH